MNLERKLQVMIVDDHPEIRDLVDSVLKDEGYEVVPCEDGQTAQKSLEESGVPDVALIDAKLPDIDGLTLVKRWREDPLYNSIRVIAFTADDDAGKKMVLAGLACEFIGKPFDLKNFLEIIAKHSQSGSNGINRVDS